MGSPVAVEHVDAASTHSVDGTERRSCADGARHERRRVRAAGHRRAAARQNGLECRLRALSASLARCQVELRRSRHAVPVTYATAATSLAVLLHLGVRQSLCAVKGKVARERM